MQRLRPYFLVEYEDSWNTEIFAKKQRLKPYFLMENEYSRNKVIFAKKAKLIALLFDGI